MCTSQVRNAFSSRGREVGGRGSHTHSTRVHSLMDSHVHTQAFTYTDAYTGSHTPKCSQAHALNQTCVHAHMCLYAHSSHSCSNAYTHRHMLTHTHTHIHTRAHTNSPDTQPGKRHSDKTGSLPKSPRQQDRLAESSEASGHRGACLWDACRSRVLRLLGKKHLLSLLLLPFPCGCEVVRGQKRWAWPSRRAGQGTSSH